MTDRRLTIAGVAMAVLITAAAVPSAVADGPTFSTLYKFEAPAATTFTSALGSQPDTLPVVGEDGAIYGMTGFGGQYGNGVIYRFDQNTHQYKVLHTFSALNANGENADGATPGMALTRGPGDVIYGMASYGGQNGSGTIFKITTSGQFTVLYSFSALNASGNNPDGAYPLRALVVGNDGNLYGTTRLGGPNTCLFTHGCGVAWMIDSKGNFKVIHPFTADEGHAASMLQAIDGYLYGCAVGRLPPCPPAPCPQGPCTGWRHRGKTFKCSTPSVKRMPAARTWMAPTAMSRWSKPGPVSFMGWPLTAEPMAMVSSFRYSLWTPGSVEVVHDFSALNSAGQNSDGASPGGRLASRAAWHSLLEHRGRRGKWQRCDLQPQGGRLLRSLAHLQCNQYNHGSQ